jgi:hypothetical protein
MSLEPIETEYSGTMYRSRTEARWAVMLDSAGVGFQYEPEGFEFVSGRYVPDFWISGWDRYLEIKPAGFDLPAGEWPRERCVAEELAEQSKKEVLVAAGWPDIDRQLYCIKPEGIPSVSRRLLSDFVDPRAIDAASKYRFDWPGMGRGKQINDMIRRTAWMKKWPT